MQQIRVRGARTHNLKNLNLELPRERLIVVTGLSGSGKSSLTFDTLYAEGQRRYVESLSAYARQFLSMMDKPDVDSIEGLSPAIAIEQKANSHNPRSTVGTVTEIYDYLRLLYARAGTPRCPDHGIDLTPQTVSQMVDQVLRLPEGTAAALVAPVVASRKGEHLEILEDLASQGYVRVRIDGRIHEMEGLPRLDPKKKHSIEVVVDRMRVRPDAAQRLAESFETALRLAGGLARRPRGAGVLRSAARRGASAPVARRRSGARLGPAQRALLPSDPVARQTLWLRHRDSLDRAAGARAPHPALRQRRGGRRVQLP
jgi:excinuclease ABC subunit A